MKFSSQEEYGLRCLLQLGRSEASSMTIAEIGEAEGLSQAYVAKLLRILRINGFVDSVRGQEGGYTLAREADQILLSEVLAALGGRFYKPGFCDHYAGTESVCAHTFSCSIRPLWHRVQTAIDGVLEKTTLLDLMEGESQPPPALISRDELVASSQQHPA
ncbi:Rrf2 family transcriptional regulator [bacterium]|nr:Rrf2 family transcriptional regulator [bacterium]